MNGPIVNQILHKYIFKQLVHQSNLFDKFNSPYPLCTDKTLHQLKHCTSIYDGDWGVVRD